MDNELIIGYIGKIRDKASAFLMKELKVHNMKGISPSHGDILWVLLTHDKLPMKEIAALINRDKSTVTTLVNKLIDFGYARKMADANDSRISIITLTPKGKALRKDVWDISKNLRKKAYQGLTQEDKETLMRLLVKIFSNF
jgi:MarR family transcriptional regulator, organic hydroperoxide resistance regulator